MFDFKFDWQKELDTGIDSIDTQHKQLFSIGRDIEQLIRIQCIGVTDKQLLDIVCELRDFLGYHFYTEEIIMNEICYPRITAHRQFHKKCTDYVMNVDLPKLRMDPVKELMLLRDEVQSWIMEHVLQEDIKMANAYQKYQKENNKNVEETNDIPVIDKFGEYITKLDVSDVYLYKNQDNKGHLVVVFNESVNELCKLSTLERNMYFSDISKSAKLIKKLYEPDAINYVNYEDVNKGIAFHIIPKYKENGTYGVQYTLMQDSKCSPNLYRQIFEEVKSIF